MTHRVLACCCLLLAALPAFAADPAKPVLRTEAIGLKYVGAAEFEQALTGSASIGIAPVTVPGVTAWTVDPVAHSVSVVGTEAGIAEFTKLARLVDIPPAPVRLAVTALDATPALTALRPAVPDESRVRTSEVLTPVEVKSVLAAPGGDSLFDGAVANAHHLHLSDTGANRAQITLFPRLNGDGSVTLETGLISAGVGNVPKRDLRRFEPKSAFLVFSEDGKRCWLIRVEGRAQRL